MLNKVSPPIAMSAAGNSVSSGTVVFSNSNNVSFGLNGSTLTGSVANQSNQQGSVYASSNTFGTSSGTYDARSLSIAGSGEISVAASNSGWVISAPVQSTQPAVNALGASNTGNTAGNTGTSSGITWVLAGSNQATISESTAGGGPNTLWVNVTTAAQSNQSAIKGLGASNTGNTAGNTGLSTGIDWVLAGSNNITISESTTAGGPNTLWVSGANAGGAQTGISGIADSAHTQTVGTVSFANSNGVSFGISTGANTATMTASVAAQSNQTVGAYAVGNTTSSASSSTYDARSLSFSGAGAVSVGMSGASGIVVSAPPTSSLSAVSPVTIQTNGSTVSIGASVVDVTLAGNSTSAGGGYALVSSGTLTLAGGNNITLSQNGNAVTISAANAGGAQTGISSIAASSGTQTVGMVSFVNSNNITFGMSTGANTGSITASFSQTNQSAIKGFGASNTGNTTGNTGISTGIDWVIAGTNNITVSESTTAGGPNTIWLSGVGASAGLAAVYDGANSISSGTIRVTNANGVSFTINGQTLSGSVTTQPTMSNWMPWPFYQTGGNVLGQGSLLFNPMTVDSPITATIVNHLINCKMTTNAGSTQQITVSLWLGIYTRNVSTLSTVSSGSTNFQVTNGSNNSVGSLSGLRALGVAFNVNMTPGEYYLGLVSSSASASNGTINPINVGMGGFLTAYSGAFGAASAVSAQPTPGMGLYSLTAYSMPNTVAFGDLKAASNIVYPAIQFCNVTA